MIIIAIINIITPSLIVARGNDHAKKNVQTENKYRRM